MWGVNKVSGKGWGVNGVNKKRVWFWRWEWIYGMYFKV